ncbi:MaoC/PaaZ C-terminal domain-containing protein [Actinotalea sp. Marseille-Q4924]|uniref:MaoC/PaaZ C-terminal domain-containing protein n=1 Tax=Actinotalea sp. Marseille-Q4924 TaxID=2866571 RepID=UPI001CE42F54|nr:MaoC/PaaZ C-terminal domain-containing protein [Actinotalea sp. Marseille-Q4924]
MTGGAPGRVVELPAVPALGGLYGRGVVGSVRAAASRRSGVRADDLPGTRLVVRGVQADAAHLTAYQHLLGERADDVLPAGFVHVLAFPVATALLVRPEFPLPLLGMVHVANRVEQRRALRLGDALDVEVHVRALRSHRAGVMVDVVAEVSVDGERAWEGVSTYLAKGVRLDGAGTDEGVAGGRASGDGVTADGASGAGASGAGASGAGTSGERPSFVPPVPTAQWRLAADEGRTYAAVSGDRNPIHTNRLAAKAFGFPRTIAHGMDTAARALAAVGPARGDAFRWDVAFAKPVLLPSTVAVRVAREGAGFAYAAWNPRTGTPHLTGTVTPLP